MEQFSDQEVLKNNDCKTNIVENEVQKHTTNISSRTILSRFVVLIEHIRQLEGTERYNNKEGKIATTPHSVSCVRGNAARLGTNKFLDNMYCIITVLCVNRSTRGARRGGIR